MHILSSSDLDLQGISLGPLTFKVSCDKKPTHRELMGNSENEGMTLENQPWMKMYLHVSPIKKCDLIL